MTHAHIHTTTVYLIAEKYNKYSGAYFNKASNHVKETDFKR